MRGAITEVEDDEFLSQVAAMEADALSGKRRKVATTTTTATAAANSFVLKAPEEEGVYIAVLKGSKSHLFQQQFSTTNNRPDATAFANRNVEFSTGGGGGSCFKCSKSGHWARDCDANNSFTGDSLVPEKACPCGLGVCLFRTAKTEKNSGRKFYKCPQENGGCGFFEWCDKLSGTDNLTIRSQNYTVNPSVLELSCPCGAGSCLTLTAKTGNNIGQQFYRCPASQRGCGFFKWCNDQTMGAGLSGSLNISKVYKNSHEASNKNHGVIGCFKCGKDGHWARDCNQPSFQSPVISGGKMTSSNTCFKCGKPGHWAKDCSSTQM